MNEVRNIIDRIKDKNKRTKANDLLATLENGCFKIPASTSGRYHPLDERGEWGTLIHIYRFAAMVPQCVRMAGLDPMLEAAMEDDMLITAIFHDSYKPVLKKEAYWRHPWVAATLLNRERLVGAAVACALHEGPWTDRRIQEEWGTWIRPANTLYPYYGIIAHTIDYFMSRYEAWQIMQPEFGDFVRRVSGIPAS